MIPTWMAVDKVMHEMDSVRRSGGEAGTDGIVAQELSDADR